ncbi:hypothetical protein ACHAXA_011907 [Cyclostephanos tholiformis]|uniref:Uncharacterized protein n=1 Tax=Cyclostephanos tholiformis TaxID=382380 RepID=A0ABD3SC55_9STRA
MVQNDDNSYIHALHRSPEDDCHLLSPSDELADEQDVDAHNFLEDLSISTSIASGCESSVSVASVRVVPALSTSSRVGGGVDNIERNEFALADIVTLAHTTSGNNLKSDSVKLLEHAEPACEKNADALPPQLPPLPTANTPRPPKGSLIKKLNSSKVFSMKISMAKKSPPLVNTNRPSERGEVDSIIKFEHSLNNAPDKDLCVDETDEDLSISTVMMERKQSKCSNVTDDTTSNLSSIADASVKRAPSSPGNIHTGGLMGKFLACSTIPFQCHADDVGVAASSTYMSQSMASGVPVVVFQDDGVDEILNVEAYQDTDSKYTRIGFLDREIMVESPVQNLSKEKGTKVTSKITLITRMMPRFEVGDIARRLNRPRNRA